MDKPLEIDPIYKALKDLIISVILLAIFLTTLFYIFSSTEFNIQDDENYMLYILLPSSFVMILLYISIYRLAKSLNKNAAAWVFANIAFPAIAIFSILYFFIIAIYQIVRLKIKGYVEHDAS